MDEVMIIAHAIEDKLNKYPNELKKNWKIEKLFYHDCKYFTRMPSIVSLYNLKATNILFDKYFNQILNLGWQMFPSCNEFPSSMYDVKKSLSQFGMDYIKIHVCPNDSILC